MLEYTYYLFTHVFYAVIHIIAITLAFTGVFGGIALILGGFQASLLYLAKRFTK